MSRRPLFSAYRTSIRGKRKAALNGMLLLDPQAEHENTKAAIAALGPEPKKRAARQPSAEPSEHQSQAAVIKWWAIASLKYKLPQFALFAIPNGGARGQITGALLKAEGLRRGCPDLMLAAPISGIHGLYIEMKRKGESLSPDQKAFAAYLSEKNYWVRACWSAEEAIDQIISYLEIPF